jgi:signal transduction histidine kinase
MERLRVLVADDDIVDQMAFARLVRSADLPIECIWADCVAEAQQAIASHALAGAVVDYWLGDGSALDLLPALQGVPTLVVAGSADPAVVRELQRAGAVAFLEKDTGPEYETQLTAALTKTLGLPQPSGTPAAPTSASARTPVLHPAPPPDAEAARCELHEFVNVVAHDLKAPARGILTLVEMLFEEHGETLGERGRTSLQLLRRRADRLIALVDRIREYALLSREPAWAPVDLHALALEVIGRVGASGAVRIVVEDRLPTVRGDRTRLALVFEHVLGNAVKFMQQGQGEVRVRAARGDAGWQLSVSDNGPGIEPEFLDVIFRPCKTLAPQDSIEGSGMGLAIARKVVQLHGGRIWAESQGSRGSTFHFTLPAA